MKTWQMIKELTENPYKEYISKEATARRAYVKRGVLFIVIDETGKAALDTDLNREWQEVKEPVTWQEAMQAFVENNKNFRIEMPSGNAYTQRQGYKIGALKVNGLDSRFFEMDMFTEGKWYIED